MKPAKPLLPLDIRRTRIIDVDRVRYRVYRTPNEFVAVIAENALMAMKLSGIIEPYKVVRDLVKSTQTIDNSKLTTDEIAPRHWLPLEEQHAREETIAIAHEEADETQGANRQFQPMALHAMNQGGKRALRIIPSQLMLDKIQLDPLAYAEATQTEEAKFLSTRVDTSKPVEPPPEEVHAHEIQPAVANETSAAAHMPIENAPELNEEIIQQHVVDTELSLTEIAQLLSQDRPA